MPTFHGGRLPLDPAKPRLMLSPRLLRAEVVAPPSIDYVSKIARWPMYGNDMAGDCVEATHAHAIQVETLYGAGKQVVLPDHVPLDRYIALTGYDPATGANDTGLNMQDALNDWRRNGLGGHGIEMFAFIDPDDTATIDAAIATFGWVAVGVDFPDSAMTQFDKGQPWMIEPGASIEGGHAVPVAAYTATGNRTCVTWGRKQVIYPSWWAKYVEEVWVVVSADWLSSTSGLSPAGLDLYGLGEDFTALTGKPNPVPPPGTAPSPVTTTDVDDDRLAKDLLLWLDGKPFFYKKTAQKATRRWLLAKGYEP